MKYTTYYYLNLTLKSPNKIYSPPNQVNRQLFECISMILPSCSIASSANKISLKDGRFFGSHSQHFCISWEKLSGQLLGMVSR